MARVALVTGGSRGIGKAIAQTLTDRGYRVAINYNRTKPENEFALAVKCDLADPVQAKGLVAEVESKLGPVEILVNNAAKLARGDLFEMNQDEFEAMRKVNVDGLTTVTRAAANGMKSRQWGRIVNLTSIAGHGTAFTGVTFYAATKAAVSLLTRRFAYELGPFGITVNAVAPGFIMTDMVTESRTPPEIDEIRERMSSRAMMRRVGQPEDIAHAVAFVVSDEASFLTAQVLTVDGGRMDYIAHP